MNNFYKFFLIFFFLILLSGNFCLASDPSQSKNYYYESIKVDIQINQDSTFDVVEEQTYHLQGSFEYFYRDIEKKKLDHISNIEVFDGEGRKLEKDEYKVSNKGNRKHIQWDFERRVFNNELKSWTIKYKVHGGLGFYDDWDELYWNAIFDDREAMVKNAEVIVHLTQEVSLENIGLRLFIGKLARQVELYSNYEIIDNKTIRFWGENIQPGRFLTIVVTWPKGLVSKPLFYQNQLIDLIALFLAIIIPIVVFIRAFSIWQEKGKDPKIKKTIIAHYSPPEDLSPALIGVLMNQKVDMKDITATVVDLAVRGYLRIREEEKKFLFFKGKEYIFEKLKSESDLRPYEQEIIKAIFKGRNLVSSKDLRNKFYKEIPEIKKALHSEAGKTGHFARNIQQIRKEHGKPYVIFLLLTVIGMGVLSIIITFLIKDTRYIVDVFILAGGLVLSSVIGLIFAYLMPALTPKGLGVKWKSLGFKEYLHTAERFRIGAETLDTFSKYLPYAVIFRVEKKWAQRFSDFSYQKQNWYLPAHVYSGKAGAPASFGDFSSSFSSFASSISKTFSPPSSSGAGAGGGAGGGGGGGGGGAG